MSKKKVVDFTEFLVNMGFDQFLRVEKNGKKPLDKKWQKNTLTQDEIRDWIAEGGNYGVVIPEGFIVIDIDDTEHKDFVDWDLQPTMTSVTGRGGFHFAYKLPEGVKLKNNPLKAVSGDTFGDIKTVGGFIVAIGSVHENGNLYELENDIPVPVINTANLTKLKSFMNYDKPKSKPAKKKVMTLTEDMINDKIKDYSNPTKREKNTAEKIFREQVEVVRSNTEEGNRNHQLNASVFQVARLMRYLNEVEVKKEFMEATTLPTEEAIHCIETSIQSGKDQPSVVYPSRKKKFASKSFKLTDKGNSERFAHYFESELLYTNERYYAWTGKLWQIKKESEMLEHAFKFCDRFEDEVADMPEETEAQIARKDAHYKHWKLSCSLGKMKATLNGACHLLAINPDLLNADPLIINALNGVIDLVSLKLQPHDPKFLCTQILGVNFNVNADQTDWLKYLDTILNDKIEYFQKMLGYGLRGDNPKQMMWVVHGIPGNGKSSFFETIGKVTGSYGPQAPVGMFEKKKGHQPNHNAEYATLAGARMMFKDEIETGAVLDTTFLKRLTGTSHLEFRRPHDREMSKIKNITKPIIYVNDLPNTYGDEGLARRLNIIHFDAPKITEDQLILGCNEHMYQVNGEAALLWMIQGLEKYTKTGLKPPRSVVIATEQYIESEDRLSDYADSSLVFESNYYATKKEIYDYFCDQYKSSIGMNTFSRKFEQKFDHLIKTRDDNGKPLRSHRDKGRPSVYHGVSLMTDLRKLI